MELGVQEEGQHQADDHHDGVPGGADEPDALVEDGEAAPRQLVGQPLYPPGLNALLDGFEPTRSF